MDIPEKLAEYGTHDEDKHSTICVGYHHVQASTNNVNKARALLQTTGDKDKALYFCPSIHGFLEDIALFHSITLILIHSSYF
jgi:hypothetical protein